MKCQTDVGPGCPACGSGEWRFVDPTGDFHRDSEIPRAEVTAEATCADCGQDFSMELSISDDSIWRSTVVPRSMGPLVCFTWLDRTLYAYGRTLTGRGSHYHEEYRLEAVRTPGEEDSEGDGVEDVDADPTAGA